jgi:hypothetical protein
MQSKWPATPKHEPVGKYDHPLGPMHVVVVLYVPPESYTPMESSSPHHGMEASSTLKWALIVETVEAHEDFKEDLEIKANLSDINEALTDDESESTYARYLPQFWPT